MNRVVFILFLTLPHNIICLNILAIISMPLRSHYIAFQPLFRELANRGHNVNVINNYPDVNPVPNLHFYNMINTSQPDFFPTLESYETKDSFTLHLYNFYRHIYTGEYIKKDCLNLFNNENAKAHLAKSIKYDVIFVEQFMSDCGLAYAATYYDAPIIGITSHVLLPWSYSRLGIPFDLRRDAFYFSNCGPNPSLYHKVESALMHFVFNTIGKWVLQSAIYEVFEQYAPQNNLDVEEIARQRMKMMFVYQHFSLTGARLLGPQVLEIGGLHIGNVKPVPKEIETFLSTADYGAIYVSFGSNLQAKTMSKEKLQQFLDAFKQIPQKVIWKYENSSLPEGYDNIYTGSWLPQLDILCHPKVLAFVAHAGMLGLSEATHCGKPVVTVPFFGDQFTNAANVRVAGMGKTIFFKELNSNNLVKAINEVLSTEVQNVAKFISKKWHDRPLRAVDSAIYWTEYVARHRDAPPSLHNKNSTWFESLLLDVYALLLCFIFLLVVLLKFVFKLIKFVIIKLFYKESSKFKRS